MTDSTRVFHDESDGDAEEVVESPTKPSHKDPFGAIDVPEQQQRQEDSLIDLKPDAPIINLD